MKKHNHILTQSQIAQQLESMIHPYDTPKELAAYESYIESAFNLMVDRLFGRKASRSILTRFHQLTSRADARAGAHNNVYYHDMQHAMQVTIRVIIFLRAAGYIKTDLALFPSLETERKFTEQEYIDAHVQTEPYMPFDLVGQLVLAAMFHDLQHSCGLSMDVFNIARAISSLEPYLDGMLTDVGLDMAQRLQAISEITTLIKATQFPYNDCEPGENFTVDILRLADLLSVTQSDWLSTCYWGLINEQVNSGRVNHIDPEVLVLNSVSNQFGFITALTSRIAALERYDNVGLMELFDTRGLIDIRYQPFFLVGDILNTGRQRFSLMNLMLERTMMPIAMCCRLDQLVYHKDHVRRTPAAMPRMIELNELVLAVFRESKEELDYITAFYTDQEACSRRIMDIQFMDYQVSKACGRVYKNPKA